MRNVVRFWRTALRRRQHQQPPLPPQVLFPSPRSAMGGRTDVRVLPHVHVRMYWLRTDACKNPGRATRKCLRRLPAP